MTAHNFVNLNAARKCLKKKATLLCGRKILAVLNMEVRFNGVICLIYEQDIQF